MFNKIFQVFTAPLFQIGSENISLLWLFKLVLSLLIVAIITRIFKRFLKHRLLGKLGIDKGNREAIATLISYAIATVGCVFVLQANGFNLATFAVIVGALGVGIGFGLQDITKNLISGLTLLIERKLKVGDFISFDGISGYIEEISIRAAVLRTIDGEEVIIPNSQLVENRIINQSYNTSQGKLKIPVGVAYGTDPVLVTEVLLNSAYMVSEVLNNPAPQVMFINFGDNALNFELWVWVNHLDLEIPLKSSLNFSIEYNLRKAGISIPFPQRDIWIKNPEVFTFYSPPETQPEQDKIKPVKSLFLRDLLQQVTYFNSLNELHLRNLIEMGYRRHLEPSEILFHQGDPANTFCIVLHGAIAAISEKGDIKKHLFTFSEGQFFGELPLILQVPYPTTMQAVSETILFMINHQSFEQLLQHYTGLAEEIALELSRRKEVLEEHRKELQAAGLIETESDEKSLLNWIRKRLFNNE